MANPSIQWYLASNKLYYFRVVTAEGELFLQSEGYLVRLNMEYDIRSIQQQAENQELYKKIQLESGRYQFEIQSVKGLLPGKRIGKSPYFDTAEARDAALQQFQKHIQSAAVQEVTYSSISPIPQLQLPMNQPPIKLIGQKTVAPKLHLRPVVLPETLEFETTDVFFNQKVESHIADRILAFLNRVRQPADIVKAVQDDPKFGMPGQGRGIGETVAARVLEQRDKLEPFRRFNSLAQLEGIAGFGEDKFRDLVYSFSSPAAEAFKQSMYDGVILDNWSLEYYTTRFETQDEFEYIAQNETNLTDFVAGQVQLISRQKYGNDQASYLADLLLRKAYLELFTTEEFAAIAFAFWFYRYDSDNWFSLERVREETNKYFSYYSNYNHRMELLLFKGFPNTGILANAITVEDLPVVLNYGEKAITIWVAQLND